MSGSVLIVEDNITIRKALADLLSLRGYKVLQAGDGQEALERLREHPLPALILLDLMMPGMDGWTFLEHKERDSALAPIPVVLTSAVASILLPRQLPSVVASINKGCDLPALQRFVERYCGEEYPEALAI